MKNTFISVWMLCISFTLVQAQNTYLWPIADAKPGTGIISKPQDYINKELNFADLFIAAPLGTIVVAPVDGTIQRVGTQYITSIHSVWGGGVKTTIDAAIADTRKGLDKQYDPQYVTGYFSIQSADGNVIHIIGITSDQIYKTGQKITRGTPIGKVSYSYRALKEPSIEISISRNGKSADPMTPFGLKTTYIAPAAIKPILSLTKQQLKEDFLLYINILKECYPGLYDVLTPEDLERYVAETQERIDARTDNWPYPLAVELFKEVAAKIHDSHIYMDTPEWYWKGITQPNQPQVALGWVNDTLICLNATAAYKRILNRPVKAVNGVPAEELKRRLLSQIGSYDAGVKDYVDFMLFGNVSNLFRVPEKKTFDFNMRLDMADKNEVVTVPALNSSSRQPFIYKYDRFMWINRHKGGYKTQMLNDSTAYIGISGFDLNQVQVEDIAHFIDSVARVPHLIIDVRNNGGGNADVLSQLYTYIAGKPMTLHSYSKVNKQGNYQSFTHSTNRLVEDSLFADYKPEPDKEGFYSRSESGSIVKADSAINYKGKVYVLTNENSISAATLFPALLVRNHRGVVVGRETRTAYHFMNAYKFVNIRLPHSTLFFNVPLVYCCFDTEVNRRAPYGRGVLPDYEVPISLDEVAFKSGDAILNSALQLIKGGKYLKEENPFQE